MTSYYAITRFENGSNDNLGTQIMLYRFTRKSHRDAWVKCAPTYRLSLTRDMARGLFEGLRGNEGNVSAWCGLDLNVTVRREGGARAVRVRAQYYTGQDGFPVTAPYEMVPIDNAHVQWVINNYRRDHERRAFERDHLIIAHLD